MNLSFCNVAPIGVESDCLAVKPKPYFILKQCLNVAQALVKAGRQVRCEHDPHRLP